MSETSSVGDTRQLMEIKEDDGKAVSNMPMTTFNFINSIIGSGIIGIPFALKQAGFGLGIILVILVAVTTDYSVLLLVETGKLSNTHSYQDMMLVTYGRPGFFLLSMIQFLYPIIAMTSYNVIIGDTITKIIVRIDEDTLKDSILGKRQFIIFLVSLFVLLPLCLYKDVAKLSKWSGISVLLIVFILISMIIRLVDFGDSIPPTEDAWVFAKSGFTQAIGVMAFAYICHHNTFLVHQSLENPTKQRWTMVTHTSVMVSMTMLILFGIVGYASFTGYTQGDVLENYCYDDNLMTAARFAFAITMMFTYPIECFVTREVIENSIFHGMQPPPMWRHVVVTVLMCTLAGGLSMITDCLSIILVLDGVLTAAPLAFILPTMCVIKLRQDPIFSRVNIGAILVFLFGVVVAVVGFVMAVIDMVDGINCSHGLDMPYCDVSSSGNHSAINSDVFSPAVATDQSLIP